jgi:hypothetical protein
MSFKCKIGLHSWNGCKCSICGKIRDKHHIWGEFKCTICGKKRFDDVDWSTGGEDGFTCGTSRLYRHTKKPLKR